MRRPGKRTFVKSKSRRYELVHRPYLEGSKEERVFRLVHEGQDVTSTERLAYRGLEGDGEDDVVEGDEEVEEGTEDEYDYEQHMREMGVDPSAVFVAAERGVRNEEDIRREEDLELRRMRREDPELDAVMRALDGDEEGEEGEGGLEDDFFVKASGGYVEGLQKPERSVCRGDPRAEGGTRLLDEKFEKLIMDEYDGDEEDEDVDWDGNARDRQRLDVMVKEELEGVPIGLKENNYLVQETRKPWREDPHVLRVVMESDSDSEELVVVDDEDGEKWDCETILSTYTNLENHPQLIISEKPNRHRRPKDLSLASEGPAIVSKAVSSREEVFSDVAMSTVRRKDETSDEKRERKARVKEERRVKRQLKSEMRTMFREESRSQANAAVAVGNYRVRVMM
eukprot:CAMPEP_0184690220 /NCGR_PEP_ID=MMETSP0312-20130426/31097_1 /TAXON_ID=31354 /ORGANISM="Compsopogon coeruleus, Strain SAG 36.94" /LENGTH=395 /DNA_ID=CAMNT_0027147677 /DNA_START=27 /DNA_END=1214 /DNA_ORIENTATION=+